MAYAHALIEHEGTRYQRGDEVPDDLPGIDELREAGSVRDEEYVAPEPENHMPLSATPVGDGEVVIDGVVYKRVADGADTDEQRR